MRGRERERETNDIKQVVRQAFAKANENRHEGCQVHVSLPVNLQAESFLKHCNCLKSMRVSDDSSEIFSYFWDDWAIKTFTKNVSKYLATTFSHSRNFWHLNIFSNDFHYNLKIFHSPCYLTTPHLTSWLFNIICSTTPPELKKGKKGKAKREREKSCWSVLSYYISLLLQVYLRQQFSSARENFQNTHHHRHHIQKTQYYGFP